MPTRRQRSARAALALIALLSLASFGALAQDEATDPPSRVGRISDFAGELFLATPDRANEWAPIGLNYPVTAGDNLWVSANGRAEIDFGGGRLRLAGDTNLQVAALDDAQLALFVASGRVILRLRSMSGDSVHIDTPHAQIDIVRPGQYRVDVDAAGQRTVVSVREGEAGVRFAGGVQQTIAGQVATVMGIDGAGLAVQTGLGSDGFDAWSAAREQRYDNSRAAAYVSPEMVGVRDLDDYGTWEATPTYGAVWYPSTVAVGWAPYRYGSWTWVAPFGWTWVDSAPWGYAPFHYGRWIYAGGRWGWCPGERTGRPRWAPALVAWYGGSGWAGGSNAYGWVPLGWGEAYTPSWGRCSGRCLRQYNQPYAVAQTDRRGTSSGRYINASVPGAMTAVPAGVMSGSRPVAPNQINIGSAGAASAPMLGGAPALGLAPARNAGRPAVAGPIPAGAQFQQMEMSRNARAATPQRHGRRTGCPASDAWRNARAPGGGRARREAPDFGCGSPEPAAPGRFPQARCLALSRRAPQPRSPRRRRMAARWSPRRLCARCSRRALRLLSRRLRRSTAALQAAAVPIPAWRPRPDPRHLPNGHTPRLWLRRNPRRRRRASRRRFPSSRLRHSRRSSRRAKC